MNDFIVLCVSVICITAAFVFMVVHTDKLPTVVMDPVTKECFEVINGDFECGDHYGKKYNVRWERRLNEIR